MRDAVLAWWRVAFVLVQLGLAVASARAEEQATNKLTSPGKPAAGDAMVPRLRLRAPRLAAPPASPDEAIEPPAFGVSPSVDETSDSTSTEKVVDTMSRPEGDPPAVPVPALSLDIPERPALVLRRPMESSISEEALLSPAAAPAISEAPPSATPKRGLDLSTPPEVVQTDDDPTAPVDVLSLLRMEIKQRLPYFEGCARSARRRNGLEVRRLQATWTVAPDGNIKSIKVDGINDLELGACIVRVAARPFTAHPGAELVIHTPIVFVR